MNTETLKILGQIAGIGGIALGVFLILFRDVIRKRIFPQLTRQQGYRIILVFMILTWSIAIAGIAAWVISRTGTERGSGSTEISVLMASLWKVELDTKGALVASQEVAGSPGGGVTQAMLGRLADWIAQELGVSEVQEPSQVKVTVRIPADLGGNEPVIQRVPAGPMEVLVWDVRGGGKFRLPLSVTSLRHMDGDFYLEFRVPGYGVETLKITRGHALDKVFELKPNPVSVGVEGLGGQGVGIADRLCEQLSLRPRFKVVSPNILENIREEVRAYNDRIAKNPMIQMPLRELGVDYLVSVSVHAQTPPLE